MSAIPGSLIGLQFNGVFTSCEISSDINFSADMLPASAVDSGGWKEFIRGIKSWSMSVNGQLLAEAVGADFKTMVDAFDSGQPVFVSWGTRPSAVTQLSLSGFALVSAGSATGPNKGKATWTINFQGTGVLDTNFQDYSLIIDAMPAEADYPIIFDLDVT